MSVLHRLTPPHIRPPFARYAHGVVVAAGRLECSLEGDPRPFLAALAGALKHNTTLTKLDGLRACSPGCASVEAVESLLRVR